MMNTLVISPWWSFLCFAHQSAAFTSQSKDTSSSLYRLLIQPRATGCIPPAHASSTTAHPHHHHIWGWPGVVFWGSSRPRSCQWPSSFPWAEHTIEKGLWLRGSVAINPYQLFLPRVFCATIHAPEGALTSTNLAIVGQECWQKKRFFFFVSMQACVSMCESWET